MFAANVVSTSAHEGPFAFTPDGETIYFTRFVAGTAAPTFLVSHRKNGRWSAPLKADLPAGVAVSPFSVSPDGDHLLFTHQPDSSGHMRLWVADRKGDGWKNAKPLGGVFEGWDGDQTSPSITRDGTLYFTSNRPGGAGGWDIYRSVLKDGQYAEPELLGGGPYAVLSTVLEERGAAIAPDGNTLIFTSIGAPNGLGGSDLYLSDLRERGWFGLSADNLGVAVNSMAEETNPQLSPDGKHLYFLRSGDIYEADMECVRSAPLESSVWKPRASMPTGRDWPQLAAIGSRIYVYGGLVGGLDTNTPRRWTHAVDVYDTVTDSWSSLPSGPADWAQATLVSVDNRLFLFRRGGPGVAEFNFASNLWELRPGDSSFVIGEAWPFQTRTVVLDHKAYMMFGDGSELAYFAAYDFEKGSWTAKSALPYPTPLLVSYRDRIYAFSGNGTHTSVYDPAADRWSELAPSDMPRMESATAVFNDQIWLIGGHSARTEGVPSNISPTVVRFDSAHNEWHFGPALPRQRACVAAISVNGRLFVIGGIHPTAKASYDRSVLEYRPDDTSPDAVADP